MSQREKMNGLEWWLCWWLEKGYGEVRERVDDGSGDQECWPCGVCK